MELRLSCRLSPPAGVDASGMLMLGEEVQCAGRSGKEVGLRNGLLLLILWACLTGRFPVLGLYAEGSTLALYSAARAD